MIWLHNDQPLGREYVNLYSPGVGGAGARQLESVQMRFLNHVGVRGNWKCSKSAADDVVPGGGGGGLVAAATSQFSSEERVAPTACRTGVCTQRKSGHAA